MCSRMLVCALLILAACSKDNGDSNPGSTDDSGSGDDSGSSKVDADKDGYNRPEDCDDTNPAVHPDANEVCDEIDNDCVGGIDEGVTTAFYRDGDADGYGAGNATDACAAPTGYVANADDCDDATAAAYPGGTEVCDGIDNDCVGGIDDGDATVPGVEDVVGDDLDANCDGYVDNGDFDLDDAGFSISGDTSYTYVGWSIGSGDLDGDGMDDLLVGSPFAWTSTASGGVIYVVNSGESGDITVAHADATITGSSGYESLGSAVAADDVDGDGYDDLIAAATWSSQAFLFLGPVGSTTTASADVSLQGTAKYSSGGFGYAIAIADLDGDTDLETAIAEPYDSTLRGAVSIFSGAASSADVIVTGWSRDADMVVGNVGDIDADGDDDLAVAQPRAGSWNQGELYLIDVGSSTGTVTASSIAVATITGEPSDQRFGHAIAGGDFNDDGYSDLFAASPEYDEDYMGRVYGWLGPVSGAHDASTADVMVTGDVEYGYLGWDIELGDIRGDGADELLIGHLQADHYAGQAYVLDGPTTGSIDLSAMTTLGKADDAASVYSSGNVGSAVGTIGDWYGDGTDDVIVAGFGMPYDATTYYAGRTWVVASDDL